MDSIDLKILDVKDIGYKDIIRFEHDNASLSTVNTAFEHTFHSVKTVIFIKNFIVDRIL